jgi:hypothetical protein
MRLRIVSLALLVGTVCGGQQSGQRYPIGTVAEKGIQVPVPQVAPLKCGKYEHVEWDEEVDVIAIPENHHPYHKVPGSERCAPDLHVITEKEFQQLLERIKKLEEKSKK